MPGILSAQSNIPNNDDTIRIEEITIKPTVETPVNRFFKQQKLDSAIISNLSYGNLADVLTWNTPVLIKNYGPGGSSTLSFRGTGASNSNVTWNGLKIDNPMLGQTDLSLLPVGLIDEMSIYYGGASMKSLSGATGGVIALDNKPVWENRNVITLNSFAGSFNRFSGLITVKSGTEYFQSITKGYFQAAKNDFSYTNDVSSAHPFRDIRKHSEGRMNGFMQELYLKKNEDIFSLRFWYQNYRRNLPASLLVYPEKSGGEQTDEAVRMMLDYTRNTFSIKAAYLHTTLDYANSLSLIDSRNNSSQFFCKAEIEAITGKFASLDLIIGEELFTVNTNNYDDIPLMNVASISADASTVNTGNIEGNILIRQILHNDKLLIPDFSTGISYRLFQKSYYLRANYSRSSRLPSLNDLFWSPGGNEYLKNEYSYISEISLDIKETLSDIFNLELNVAVYNNHINNMIRWKPATGSVWSAENIGEAKGYGFENTVKLGYNNNNASALFTANYSYTKSFDNSDDIQNHNQIIYIPKHQANASVYFKYGKLTSAWKSSFSGIRFIEADNSKYLPAFLINSMSAGIQHDPNWGLFQINFDIENIFNCQYETMAYYPLPGRSYGIRLTIQLTK
ncbi:MAG TPA: TonB-dependent receptor [Bacteroidales bacterium]|nr:TonB-dependent receptor [Bacteroidales bacterium]